MSAIHHVPLFLLSGLLLSLTPGPDLLLISTRSMQFGLRGGVAAALGVGVGCLVHAGAVAVGLSALIAASALLFTALKGLGAVYLVWIGIGLVGSRAAPLRREEPGGGDGGMAFAPSAVFRQGLFTNLLNPKIILFFLAFLPQFVDPGAARHGLGLFLLGLIFAFNGTLLNLGVAWAVARAGARLVGMRPLALWMRRLTGGVFIALGIGLARLPR